MQPSPHRTRKRVAFAVAALLVLGTPLLASARIRASLMGAATSQRSSRSEPVDQVAAAQALLTRMRGTNAVACELAMRTLDNGNWYSSSYDVSSLADSARLEIPHEITATPAVDVLWLGMRDEDACVRRAASSLFGRARSADASQRLRGALTASEAETRRLAAFSLGLAEDSTAARQLEALLRDPSDAVRATAAWALGELEYAPAIASLANVLVSDASPRARRAAARALGRISG
ncbi:MAG: HEAT repeat domain-containing protein [Gemmatimonadota bacterium]